MSMGVNERQRGKAMLVDNWWKLLKFNTEDIVMPAMLFKARPAI